MKWASWLCSWVSYVVSIVYLLIIKPSSVMIAENKARDFSYALPSAYFSSFARCTQLTPYYTMSPAQLYGTLPPSAAHILTARNLYQFSFSRLAWSQVLRTSHQVWLSCTWSIDLVHIGSICARMTSCLSVQNQIPRRYGRLQFQASNWAQTSPIRNEYQASLISKILTHVLHSHKTTVNSEVI